jgi:hypothetical protein
MMAIVFFTGILTVVLGLILYLLYDYKLKRKLILTTLSVSFQVLLLPVLWGINDVKLNLFLSRNKTELELIAENLLDSKWTWQQAYNYRIQSGIEIKMAGLIEKDQTVLFTLRGFIDNTHGLAYSRTGREAYRSVPGHIGVWKKINKYWYEWGTS